MKHKFLVFIIPVLLTLTSCGPVLISSDLNKKADIEISDGKAIFFVQDENKIANPDIVRQHTQISDAVYNAFGGATDKMFIGRTNAQSFRFKRGKQTWFIETKLLQQGTAMILFDGHDKLIIEYQTKNYTSLIKRYFGKELSNEKSMYLDQKVKEVLKPL